MASTTVAPTLPEGAGYGVVVGIGFFFTVVMAGISWAQVSYFLHDQLIGSSILLCTEPIHQILYQSKRRVQYRKSQYQAGPHSLWCRFSLDLGGNIAAKQYSRLRVWHLRSRLGKLIEVRWVCGLMLICIVSVNLRRARPPHYSTD
jgi:hypothetical protein